MGVLGRRSGAVGCMERVALRRAAAAKQLLHRTIATQVSPTGWPGGLWPRRLGAARTEGRAARQLREVAPEIDALYVTAISAGACRTIFWRWWLVTPPAALVQGAPSSGVVVESSLSHVQR